MRDERASDGEPCLSGFGLGPRPKKQDRSFNALLGSLQRQNLKNDPGSEAPRRRGISARAISEAANAGYHIFVLGIWSDSNDSSRPTLNEMAVRGLEPTDNPNPLADRFYRAGSDAELNQALTAITSAVATCRFDLAKAPSVHCPALSSDLMSSTLFGHKKGAFTGAVTDATGKVQQAEGGTLLLDEVADLSADAQARLLRFLNDKAYERLGDPQERKADVRVLAATNRNLERAVENGRFREDLFYRLNVVTLDVPPLRERPEDILPLATAYLEEARRKQGRGALRLSPKAEASLLSYHWPGNLRELHNAIERAVILGANEAPISTSVQRTRRRM